MHREPSPDATPPTPKADAPIDAPTDALTSAPTSATTPSAVDRPHSPASIHSVSQPQPGFQPDPQSPHQPVPPYPHEPDVLPPYEPEADESTNPNDFLDNLDAFIAICPDLILPITAIPPAPTWHGTSVPADREARTATDHTNRSSSGSSSGSSTTINDAPGPPSVSPNTFRLCCSIVHHFFTAIASRQDDVVRLFITRGLVSPDVPSVTGETPLLAAVRAGDGTTLCALVELGATVDAYGSTDEADVHNPRRTPLQYAAALGRLPLVKLLREDFGADDALVAPDGEIALRLAARGRHRDVVAYLPARRAGAGLRVKTALRRGASRVARVARGVGMVFYVVLWECPLMLTYYPLREAWRARHRFAGWAKRQVVEAPRRVLQAIKKTPDAAAEACRLCGRGVRDLGSMLAKTPAALAIAWAWVARGVRGVSGAVAEAAKQVVGVLHTALAAVVGFFRSITPRDVWHGLLAVLRAVFVGLPQAMWRFLARFGEVSWDVLAKVAGTLGKAVWVLIWCLFAMLLWLPKQGWKILVSCAKVLWAAVEEVLVLLNPKRVG
ncbi:hypothetical protein VD0002_g3290 [Verticillium dahliae]|uniref:protein S-acyltransferase n=1 Tax=Verticillium dahliae TaxID=27337 RepID=A0A2J8C233_VERDA|nr:hypothetical protein BJF96_g5787 [Verticillium dahliae]PNH41028.1 hypothetical protein VD0004_g6022 [Verticillium dahliae]PNH52423.1 hypothetical protein VD0003_g4914 [Verticillium dahliae]PNH65855.1 hypothetical protein VD0002_g3290 [Verticillium dahliae]PNH71657.1 hypothetical protein VD0001_g5874 [Verticillium dahliae]